MGGEGGGRSRMDGAFPGSARRNATYDDVMQTYRLLLWRDPESAAVVGEKIGQPPRTMLEGFVRSDEFRAGPFRILDAGTERAAAQPLPAGIREWAGVFFGVDRQTARRLEDATDLQSLTGAMMAEPVLGAIVDAHYGAGTAERMGRAAERINWTGIDDVTGLGGGTSSLDMRNLYLLLLDRAPESASVAKARPANPFLDTVIEFLTSREFAVRIVGAALDGTLGDDLPLPTPLREWACRRFDLPLANQAGRVEAVAALLKNEEVTHRLDDAPIVWSVRTVTQTLDAAAGSAGREQRLSIASHLREIARGVEVQAVSGIVAGGSFGEVKYTDSDPWVKFSLSPEVARAEVVELHLRSSLDGVNNPGHLYLGYEKDHFTHEDSVDVPLDEEGFGRVVVVNPRDLQQLRWDPTNSSGSGTISILSAQATSLDDIWPVLRTRFPTDTAFVEALVAEAMRDPRAMLAKSLTKIMSRQTTDYATWLAANELNGKAGEAFWQRQLRSLQTPPTISIIVPTYNTDERLLSEMIESVVAQAYPHWELCIADDASTMPHVQATLEAYAARDRRIRYMIRPSNGHISDASNSALAMATGDWIALLDHDDLLRPNALLAAALVIDRDPEVEIIYSDEDKIDDSGRRFMPFFKPDYSPEMLLAHNYFNHLSFFRRGTVAAVGGWRKGLEGSQDYDLILRVLDHVEDARVVHIPEILYHWRATAGSTALSENEKGYAVQAGMKALRDHLDRKHPDARMEQIAGRSLYRVRHAIPEHGPLVSLIMPTRDKADLVRTAARSILDLSTYRNFELIIVDNGSEEADTFALFDELRHDERVSILPYPHPFNYSAINNFAVERSRGEIVGLVNNDIKILTPSWLEELVSWAMQPRIGCVGAKLYYPDMTIQHAGVVVGLGGIANHIHRQAAGDDPGYFGRNLVHHTVSAVTGACLFVRRAIYDEVGGLEERLQVAFNDVDFCLRVREAGYRNMYTPFAELIHYESISRGVEDTPEKIARFNSEIDFMNNRWGSRLRQDPFYSPNFDMMGEDYMLGVALHRQVEAPPA